MPAFKELESVRAGSGDLWSWDQVGIDKSPHRLLSLLTWACTHKTDVTGGHSIQNSQRGRTSPQHLAVSRKGRGRERARERHDTSWVYREQEGVHAPLSQPRLSRATQESKQMYRGWAPPNTVPLPTPYSAGSSQESDHPVPPSNALMDIFATHRVSINLGKILL